MEDIGSVREGTRERYSALAGGRERGRPGLRGGSSPVHVLFEPSTKLGLFADRTRQAAVHLAKADHWQTNELEQPS